MPSAESKEKASKYTSPSEARVVRDDSTQPLPRKKVKTVKKASRSVKIQTRHSEKTTDSSSINRVSSTTSPTLTEQGIKRSNEIIIL